MYSTPFQGHIFPKSQPTTSFRTELISDKDQAKTQRWSGLTSIKTPYLTLSMNLNFLFLELSALLGGQLAICHAPLNKISALYFRSTTRLYGRLVMPPVVMLWTS